MFTLKQSLLIGICSLLSTILLAQVPPCLSGWKYRTPVLVDNRTNPQALSGYQIEVVFNTQDLIANSKTRLDGADIRFVTKSGAVLPYCIENNTFNSNATKFWVKIPSLQASQLDSIYVFYGQPTASSIANPDTTFEFYDDFLGASVNEKNWTICPSSDITITNGTATFNTKTKHTVSVLKSKKGFTFPIVIEQSVLQLNQTTSGVAFLGLQTKNGNGYAMAFDSDQQSTVSLRRLLEKPDTCVKQIFHTSNTSTTSTASQGVWSFAWVATGNQFYKWPAGKLNAVDVTTPLNFADGVSICLGNQHNTSQLQLDWLRARKFSTIEPTCSVDFSKEVAQITAVSVSSNSPVCESGEIQLKVNSIIGVEYTWTGPLGFVSSEQNPVISSLSVAHSGYYKVNASITGGCYTVSDSVLVTVNPITKTGVSKGYTTVCSESNAGEVAIENKVGDVLRWESSTTGLAPWTTIHVTTANLAYKNLLKDSYYRAIVKSGVCKEEISDSIKIAVDANTIAGVTLGEKEVCSESNAGTLVLNSTLGSVKNWQFLEKGSSTWVDVVGTTNSFTFSNLTKTTYYRAKIQNGVCLEKFSDSVQIKVNPLPVVDFDADAVCLGVKSTFENKTTVAEGSLRNFTWDFNDGHTSSAKKAENLYVSDGTYQVNLRVESDKFCLSEKTKAIVVNPLPKVEFFHTDVCKDTRMPYEQNVTIVSGSINELKWDFGDRKGSSELLKGTYLYDNSGNYTVKLVAISDNSCRDSTTNQITIYPRASLDFKVNDVFLGEESNFINNSTISTGNLTYEWRFDDGQSAVLVNPKHVYKTARTFEVVLISTSSYGLCKDTIVKSHIVNAQTKADFAVPNVCLYDSATFENLSKIAFGTLTYLWDFGDGESSTLENPRHLYENPGTYLVKLTATSNLGSVSTATKLFTIYPLPTAKFVAPDVCDKIAANYSNLSSISGGTLTYAWDFGDGSISEDEQPTHLYAQDGTYQVRLVASSAYSCRDTLISNIAIHPLPKTLFYVDAVCDGFVSFFHDSTKIAKGSVDAYAWDFGDGTNSIVQHPEKQFLNPGSYLVALTTVSDKLCPKKYAQLVKVIESPIADFSVANVCFGNAITPLNNSSAAEGQLSYAWDFGDAQTSEFLNPSHLYALPKNYLVKLVVTTTFNCKDSISRPVTIYGLPTVESGPDQEVSQGYSVTLSATGGTNYFWTPATSLDNQGSPTPIATPFETTNYKVTVTDENGCTGSAFTNVVVHTDFKLEASNIITPDGNNQNDTWFVKNITSFPDAKVQIFDRWGKIVLSQTNYQNDWAGTSKTDVLPDGEYYYIISSSNSAKIYKGTITILRN